MRKSNWDCLDHALVVQILMRQPRFVEKVDLSKLAGEDWRRLLCAHPRFFDRYCNWKKLSGLDWAVLLPEHPQFAEKCPWSKLKGSDWVMLLTDASWKIMHYDEKCRWAKLDGEDWMNVLLAHPEWAERCAWDKLELWHWAELLGRFPDMAERFESIRKKWKPIPKRPKIDDSLISADCSIDDAKL